MLWPKNADRHAALQELVDALAAEPERSGGKPIEADDWTAWLASEEAKTLQGINPEGVHDAPLAVEAALLGHKRSLLAARLEFPTLHYRLWMEALSAISDPDLEAAVDLLMSTATICDLIVERSQLGSSKWPDHQSPGSDIAVPPQEEYERLRTALRIEVNDPRVVDIVKPLVRTQGSEPWQPLVPISRPSLLVADPWQLSLAGLVHAVARASRSSRFDDVTDRLRRAMLNLAVDAVKEMGWEVESFEGDHLVARPDLDCLFVIGVGVIDPDPQQFAEEAQSDDGCLEALWGDLASRARSLDADYSLLALIADGRGVTIGSDHPYLKAQGESDPWILGAGELQVMGEAFRQDPLALPAALRSIPPPPWPENHDLLDVVGVVRQWEEQDPADPDLSDGTEYMLQSARLMSMRHPAILPDLSRWVEVARWEGGGEAVMFRTQEEEFALLARAPGRFLWVTCPGTFQQPFELLPVIATALTFLLDRLCKAGLLLASSLSAQVIAHFRLELVRAAGPDLALAPYEKGIRMILGPGFVHSFSCGDNEADRMLAGAVLAWAEEVGDPAPDGVLDEVLPPGPGTFAIWPDPEADSNEPRLEFPPPIEARARREVELELAAAKVKPDEVAIVPGEVLEPALEDLSTSLEKGIQTKLESLEPVALLELVKLHERAAFQGVSEAVTLPSLSVWRSAEGKPLLLEEEARREMILRVLIERASALPPAGEAPLSLRSANWLRAATELQLKLRSALEAVRYEKTGGQLAVFPMVGIEISLGGDLPEASHAHFEQVLSAAPDQMVAQHGEWWSDEPVLNPDPVLDVTIELEGNWKELDLVLGEEWGVGFEQLVRLIRTLSDLAGAQPDCVASATPETLARDLAEATSIPSEVVNAAIARLTLEPCPDFDTFSEDHQPIRANRDRSYLRRPLVMLPNGEIAWSSLHCLKAGEFLAGLINSGRLRGSRRLSRVVTWISQEHDRGFEDEILEKVNDCGWQGRGRVTRLAGKRLERRLGQEIGDIDVLAWSQERQEVWLLDAKRLAPGVQPGPMLREGSAFEKYVERHQERLRWVHNHLPELAREIGIEHVSNWEIKAALVLDRPLVGAHLRKFPIPIWTHWSLCRELGSADRPDAGP